MDEQIMTGHWTTTLRRLVLRGLPVVRMAVATVKGSAPREPGATLLYWRESGGQLHSSGSIGGGHLEWRAMQIAGHLLDDSQASPHTERFTLGATLGQCCGGVVELFWERFDGLAQVDAITVSGWRWSALETAEIAAATPVLIPSNDGAPGAGAHAAIVVREGRRYFVEYLSDDATPLYLYGAGHVGKALVHVLAGLPFRIHWTDSRTGMGEGMPVPVNESDAPEDVATQAPDQAWHLVMTHSHDEDFRICEALVAKNRFSFLGVIGSGTKQARFRSRLLQRGYDPEAVARMRSPIGVGGIASKLPAAIAVAVAAQLLQMRETMAMQDGAGVASGTQQSDNESQQTMTAQHDQAAKARNA